MTRGASPYIVRPVPAVLGVLDEKLNRLQTQPCLLEDKDWPHNQYEVSVMLHIQCIRGRKNTEHKNKEPNNTFKIGGGGGGTQNLKAITRNLED